MDDSLLNRQLTYRSRCKNFFSFIEAWILMIASILFAALFITFLVLYATKGENNGLPPVRNATVGDAFSAQTFHALEDARLYGFKNKTACRKLEATFTQATYALHQYLEPYPSCKVKYPQQNEIEVGMREGAENFQKKYPQRGEGVDDLGIKPFDHGDRNSKGTVTDNILGDPEEFKAYMEDLLVDFNQKVEDILGVVPHIAPKYFVSGAKGYPRTVEKATGTCYDENITNLFDAMRQV